MERQERESAEDHLAPVVLVFFPPEDAKKTKENPRKSRKQHKCLSKQKRKESKKAGKTKESRKQQNA